MRNVQHNWSPRVPRFSFRHPSWIVSLFPVTLGLIGRIKHGGLMRADGNIISPTLCPWDLINVDGEHDGVIAHHLLPAICMRSWPCV